MLQDKQNFLMFVTDNKRTADKLCIVRKEKQQESLTFSFFHRGCLKSAHPIQQRKEMFCDKKL